MATESANRDEGRLFRCRCLHPHADATDDDGSCTYADPGLDRDGNCLADADGDGIQGG